MRAQIDRALGPKFHSCSAVGTLLAAASHHSSATPLAKGIAASPGAVTGRAVFNADDAQIEAATNQVVILVRAETSPEDLHGMKAAKGILTARGGATSHAAVVARGMGRPCVAGCAALHIDHEAHTMTVHGADGTVVATIAHGDTITIDGSTGNVYQGAVATVPAELGCKMETLLKWGALLSPHLERRVLACARRNCTRRANSRKPHDSSRRRPPFFELLGAFANGPGLASG